MAYSMFPYFIILQLRDVRYWEYVFNPQINQRSFIFQSYNLLSQFDDDQNAEDLCMFNDNSLDKTCSSEMCYCTQIVQLKVNQVTSTTMSEVYHKFMCDIETFN